MPALTTRQNIHLNPQLQIKMNTPNRGPKIAAYAGKLPVSEIFFSIQGEGRWIGCPAIFVRLQYCNLGCDYCDSQFAWSGEKLEGAGLFKPEELANKLVSIAPPTKWAGDTPHIVITGGEPLLHQDRIPDLIGRLRAKGYTFFELETNGTIIPNQVMIDKIGWWNCSPKLSNSGLPEQMRFNPKVIYTLSRLENADFKFVVGEIGDLDEIQNTYGSLVKTDRIMVMPEGTDRETQIGRMNWLVGQCMERGYRFTPRLHTLIWDNERSR